MIHLLEVQDPAFLLAMLIFFDLVSMSIIMIGVTIFFEKQEGVLKSLFVSPINKKEYISSKLLSNLVSNLITIVIVLIYVFIFKEITINLLGLGVVIILIGLLHSLLGIMFIYKCVDFTDLLIKMFMYFLLFMIPIVLEQIGIITNRIYSYALYLIPTKSSATLMEALIKEMPLGEIIFSGLYLTIASIILLYYVFNKFKDFAVRESGV